MSATLELWNSLEIVKLAIGVLMIRTLLGSLKAATASWFEQRQPIAR